MIDVEPVADGLNGVKVGSIDAGFRVVQGFWVKLLGFSLVQKCGSKVWVNILGRQFRAKGWGDSVGRQFGDTV
mgnify:CR=1 FL=1